MERRARRVALVTGASAGLGEEFSRQLAASGNDLILVARREQRLEALARELRDAHGVEALCLPIDLATPDACAQVMAGVAGRGWQIDILVNNAGFTIAQGFAEASWERQSAMIMTMVHAVCSLTHAVLPHMQAQGWGRVINVSSIAGFAPGVAGHTLYPASKSFVIKFSQSLDCELRDRGIYVTALCPGYTLTEFHAASGMSDLLAQKRRRFGADPAAVVAEALTANNAGKVIVVPGLYNRARRFALKVLPESIMRPLINRAAARFRRSSA